MNNITIILENGIKPPSEFLQKKDGGSKTKTFLFRCDPNTMAYLDHLHKCSGGISRSEIIRRMISSLTLDQIIEILYKYSE